MQIQPTLLGALALGALALAGQASAHAALVASNPAANATVAAPKTISLTFNEALTPAFSRFDVARANGVKLKIKTHVAGDKKTIVGLPAGKMMAGAYKVSWRAAATDDGHRTSGAFAFKVK